MGYIQAFGRCWVCGDVLGFNPDRPPRIAGVGPFCEPCIRELNRRRARGALPPHQLPADAWEPVWRDTPPPGAIEVDKL